MLRSANDNNLKKILANPYFELTSGEKILFLQQLLLLDESDLDKKMVDQAKNIRNLAEIAEDLETFKVSGSAAEQQKKLGRLKVVIEKLGKNASISAAAKSSVPAVTASVVPDTVPVFQPAAAAYHSHSQPVLAHSPAFSELPVLNHSLLQQSYSGLLVAKRFEFLSVLFNHIDQNLWHDVIHTQFMSASDSLKLLVNDILHENMFSNHPRANKFLEEVQVYIAVYESKNEVKNSDNRLPERAPAAAIARASSATENVQPVNLEHCDPIAAARNGWIWKFQAFLQRPANSQKRKTENSLIRILIAVLLGHESPESLISHPRYCDVFGQDHMQKLAKEALAFIEHNCATNDYPPPSVRR